jgi:uncharacterized protein DUF5666
MITLKRAGTLAGLFLLVGFAAACSGGGTASPSGPSGSSLSGGSSFGATITGTVATSLSARSFHTLGTSGGMTISITGTNVSSPVDGSGNFTLSGVPPGDDDLHISGGSSDAHVHVSGVTEHEHINVDLTVTGTTATVEDSERESENNEAEVEGLVTAIDTTAHTLTIRGKVVTVPSGTPIMHGNTAIDFAQIKVGDRVHIHGTNTTAGITATRVTVQNAASTSVDHD